MCNENSECRCISEILKVINILQKKATRNDECSNACDRPVLGCNRFCECNTRPIQLILCGQNGDDPLVMPTSTEVVPTATVASCPKPAFSSVFRVEKVDECCCTCRVLIPKSHSGEEGCEEQKFEATNSFFTIDLKCVCVVRCLEDTFVDCI
jgi:hypothetical protein